jgi:hypothetical protein
MILEDLLKTIPMAWPILVTLIGAVFAFLYNLYLARIRSAIELHAEFHTESFLKSRIRADELLQKHLVQEKHFRLADLYHVCIDTSGVEDWAHVSRVLHFFERLNAMQSAGISDRKTLARLLGSYIDYYHSSYFKKISIESGDWENLAKSVRAVKSAFQQ